MFTAYRCLWTWWRVSVFPMVHLLWYRLTHGNMFNLPLGGRDGGGDQAYSRLSTTHGHISDCKLDSVVYAGVCVWVNVDLSCLGRMIYAQQFVGAKPPIQFRHRWAERNHSDHLYWLRAAQRLPNSLAPSWEAQTSHFSRLWCDAVGDRTPTSCTPSGRFNHYAMRGRQLPLGRKELQTDSPLLVHWFTTANNINL